MCWYCCISLRGAVYFGTSVHIFVGLVLLVRWIVMNYISAFVTGKLIEDTSLLILTVLFGVYLIIFILLGCLIFAGTERQSVSLLKWSATGFTILQVLLFTVILVLYLAAPEGWSFIVPFLLKPDSMEMQILTISMYLCCLVATTNYIFVLLLYTHKLRSSKQNRGVEGRSSSLTNIQISHPITHHHQTAITPDSNSTLNTTASTIRTPNYNNYHGKQAGLHPRGGSRRSHPLIQSPESPGIYESLETSSMSGPHHPFYPANFYAGYPSGGGGMNEGIYNGASSIRSLNSGSGIYYQNHQRPYPYPHQRYREPILPSTSATASIANCTLREEDGAETPGQDYGHRLQVFQRGQQERNSATMEPLLNRQQQQQTNY